MIRRLLLIAATLLAVPGMAGVAEARSNAQITPYIEVDQVVLADLKGAGDVLTYTTLAAGVDASIAGRNAEGQVSYRYEHRFGWGRRAGDEGVHYGLARGRLTVTDGFSLEAGGIATRARSDIRGAANGYGDLNPDNVSNVYALYAGPAFARRIGDLDAAAAYRIGYTKVDPADIILPAGQPRLDQYDHSLSHYATASIGIPARIFPLFGWKLSGLWQREATGQLDQRFDDKAVRLDLTRPLGRTLALVGSAGYEKITISQRPALRDANGAPAFDAKGRFATDKSAARQLAYETDGLIWDAGLSWRPSQRTMAEFRVGRRYGSTIYTGSLTHEVKPGVAVQVTAYDGLQSFGRQLTDGLVGLPTQFATFSNPLARTMGGCIYGAKAAGTCLDDAFQSIATAQYRARGVTALLSVNRGPWSGGVGIGYARRKYLAPEDGLFFSLDGVVDQSWFGQAQIGRRLSERSSVEASLYANRYESGIAFAPAVTSTGTTVSYYRLIGRRLSATASIGLFTSDQDGFANDVVASGLIGLRYSF
ncbi:MAG: hypothetical protein DI623_01585 [Sphingomonas sanxanigenens]|uniref:Preprotein translocase subunit YajC n=1 Tax=Sphingomonas sanxanigenens TaxID=397260 RepID=A0A2W5AF13_9SPHN|nr:MAG: hypothetical protein DI623_01585 [Sphingomonas sanxanigenens]